MGSTMSEAPSEVPSATPTVTPIPDPCQEVFDALCTGAVVSPPTFPCTTVCLTRMFRGCCESINVADSPLCVAAGNFYNNGGCPGGYV